MTHAQTQYDDNRADPSDERIAWDARIVAAVGISQGRTFYSIPIGESGRIVYSIDSGIAILERAFGTDSRHDDFRKFRKDIQKGII